MRKHTAEHPTGYTVYGVRALRRKHLLTQRDLAALVGISYSVVSRIEGGDRTRARTVRALAAALHVTPETLLLAPEEADHAS